MADREVACLTSCIGTREPAAPRGGPRHPDDDGDVGDGPSPVQFRPVIGGTLISTTASALEDAVCSRLACDRGDDYGDAAAAEEGANNDDDDDDVFCDPVRIFEGVDATLLRCRPPRTRDRDGGEAAPTIFGISESGLRRRDGDGGDVPVRLTLWEPSSREEGISMFAKAKGCCCCHHPRGGWPRRRRGSSCGGNGGHPKRAQHVGVPQSPTPDLVDAKIVDLTKIQDRRRRGGGALLGDGSYPCFDSPGKVFHLLRSILNGRGGLHSASPWKNSMFCDDNGACDEGSSDGVAEEVVALLVKDPNRSQSRSVMSDANSLPWEGVEQSEANELLDFRTGDAAPSYFLHSASRLSGGRQILSDVMEDLWEGAPALDREEKVGASGFPSSEGALLLVYRRLPPRDTLFHSRFGHEEEEQQQVGCLWETYLEDSEKTELDAGSEPPPRTLPVVKHRMVSPPYLSHAREYPGLLDSLLGGLDSIREEARRIPQWTAWPEQNHYAGNSWNVFPLCYTFPADDISRRKFVHRACSFVPETTRLLRTLGPALRTALFSRLDPRSRLGAHTGWSDLANHVLRVHIPLVVPGGAGDAGLCGTWVDGVAETHDEGRVVCFDDSKVHRAFNYGEGERVVLIVDLLRPKDLPMGTATGGHSDELDAFIDGF